MPFATIRSLDSAIENQRQRAVSRVEARRYVPCRRTAHDAAHKSDIPAECLLPFIIGGTIFTTGELNCELRCGRCGVIMGHKEMLCWSCSGTLKTSDPALFDRMRVTNAIPAPIEDCVVVKRREERYKRALQQRAALASRIASCKFSCPLRKTAPLAMCAKKASNNAKGRRAPAADVQLCQWRAHSEGIFRVMYDPTCSAKNDFYEFWRYDNVRPRYARFLREGLRRGDGSFARSGVAQAVGWLHRQFPSMQFHMRTLKGLNASTGNIQPDAIEAVPGRGKMRRLRKLQLTLETKNAKSAGPSTVAGAEDAGAKRSHAVPLQELVSIQGKQTGQNSAGDTTEGGPISDVEQIYNWTDTPRCTVDLLDDLLAALGEES